MNPMVTISGYLKAVSKRGSPWTDSSFHHLLAYIRVGRQPINLAVSASVADQRVVVSPSYWVRIKKKTDTVFSTWQAIPRRFVMPIPFRHLRRPGIGHLHDNAPQRETLFNLSGPFPTTTSLITASLFHRLDRLVLYFLAWFNLLVLGLAHAQQDRSLDLARVI